MIANLQSSRIIQNHPHHWLKRYVVPLVFGAAITVSIDVNSAKAYIVTVNNTTYDVTTFTGTYTNNQTLINSQPWWGSSGLASLFVNAVGTNLGAPNFAGLGGPFFAYASPSDTTSGVSYLLNGSSIQSAPY